MLKKLLVIENMENQLIEFEKIILVKIIKEFHILKQLNNELEFDLNDLHLFITIKMKKIDLFLFQT
jgi:hypothetical protein